MHETNEKNVSALTAHGPSADKFDTGNGLGKGRGFYVTPVGNKQFFNAVKDIHYGEKFLAVYVPRNMSLIKSKNEESNSMEILEKDNVKKENCFYVMSGGGEIVVPERCLNLVKVVSSVDQLKQSVDLSSKK